MSKSIRAAAVFACWLLSLNVPTATSQALTATDLRCEYLENPIGIDEPRPRLSWIVTGERRGSRQSAYRLLVASTPEALERNEGDVWDTGKVASHQTTHIEYRGTPLVSRRACHWKVMAWDEREQPGPWSAAARLEMGLLAPADWSAKWIGGEPSRLPVVITAANYYTTNKTVSVDVTAAVRGLIEKGKPVVASNDALGGDPAYGVAKRLSIDYAVQGVAMKADIAENATAFLNHTRLPYLRRAFSIDKPVRSARLYATALGLYEPYLNGERASTARLAPGWTDYRKRVHYQTLDVTRHLRRGPNVIGATIAPGWFAGRAGLFHARAFYGDAPALLAQLEITFEDGSTQRIVSDESWRRHDGPLLISDLMDGEIHDAREAIDGWCTTAVDDAGWSPVTTRSETRTLEAAPDLPVRALMELPARTVAEPQPGRWVFDLGQNMVGVARIRVREKAGTAITIRHAEMLNKDGTLYLDNLRGAAATDTYVCNGNGDGVETWEPRFTFHGFRYVELTGLTSAPTVEAVTGVVLGSDLPPTGTFECSDPRLNQLYSNIVWGLRGNYLSVPTDCPQRDERMGWMGDAQAFIPTAAYVANVAPFMSKWMTDVRDAQRADGAHADVAPVMKGLSYGTPAWADAGVIVPWTIYETYGDQRILERNLASMTAWVEWCRGHSTGLIRDRDRGNDYGDWLSHSADTPKDLIGTAYFARSADLLARSYDALGRKEDAAKYRELFEQIRAAFAKRYITDGGRTGDDARIGGDTQTAYLLALAFDLAPQGQRAALAERLEALLRERGWRPSTGFIGVGLLLPTLEETGQADLAYKLLMQDEFPSWLFSVKHGATTIWERWDGWTPDKGMNDPGMNSFNHYALGSCGQWLLSGVGGIRAGEPGYRRIIIRPRIGEGLRWAKASFRSMHGMIATHWERVVDIIMLDVEVPANTTATLYLPVDSPKSVEESGSPLSSAEGVRVIWHNRDEVIVELASGRYRFAIFLPH